jgi:uncharacterized repeat protein (TIGR04138 family)
MTFREQLARIVSQDPRYSIEAYAFVLEALNHARQAKLKARGRGRGKARSTSTDTASQKRSGASGGRKSRKSEHVSESELCESVRKLSLCQFGLLAAVVLEHWGVRSTSDIGDIVYNLIAAGDLEKTPSDSRAEFNNIFDFEKALQPRSLLDIDETA